MSLEIPGQLNSEEREIVLAAIIDIKPRAALEVGTWMGGGSTATILRGLQQNQKGHLWGIEADRSTYEQMLENIRLAVPGAAVRFTPLFGFSQEVIPKWLADQDRQFEIDFVFLDGGNNPGEQISEFELIDPYMPVGAILMAHDAKLRKGKWLVPYASMLDNWESRVHDVSAEGLFVAKKRELSPSAKSLHSARAQLFRMRLQLAELAAAILPAKACAFFLALMPDELRRNLSEGR